MYFLFTISHFNVVVTVANFHVFTFKTQKCEAISAEKKQQLLTQVEHKEPVCHLSRSPTSWHL